MVVAQLSGQAACLPQDRARVWCPPLWQLAPMTKRRWRLLFFCGSYLVLFCVVSTVGQDQCCDLDPGSGTGFSGSRFSDPGSQTHFFKRLVKYFVENELYFFVICQKNLLYLFKNEIISIFLLCYCCWIPDTGSWMDTNQDPRSGINIPYLQHCRSGKGGKPLPVQQGTAIMMFFKKIIEVHGYIGVKSNSKTFL